ncbi:MAG: type II toxin-antitoxin system RelE/ParE family toxin [Bacteroidota bacterium]
MKYTVLLTGTASRQLEELPEQIRRRADRMINQFEENARPPQIRKLLGTRDEWRIRVGDYRVLLEIDDRNKKVVIYRILHRKEAYRK